jgi:hypothetical protein
VEEYVGFREQVMMEYYICWEVNKYPDELASALSKMIGLGVLGLKIWQGAVKQDLCKLNAPCQIFMLKVICFYVMQHFIHN